MKNNDFKNLYPNSEDINQDSSEYYYRDSVGNDADDYYAEINPQEVFEMDEEEEYESVSTKKEKLPFLTVLKRVCVFLLITAMLCLAGGLGVEYVLVKGPSPTLSQQFVLTMLETRRFGFVAGIFLTDEELAEAMATHYQTYEVSTDATLININTGDDETDGNTAGGENPTPQDYGLVDDDGDGIIIDKIKRNGYEGYMMIVLDPSRVSVTVTRFLGHVGETLTSMCMRTDSLAGINAGGFDDEGGNGFAGYPLGLTVVNGQYYNTDADPAYFVGFDSNHILHVGYYSASDVYDLGIVDGVTFGPTLVVNGVARNEAELPSGLNPRTAIGQRADGAVLMLVIDGRQVHSFGADYSDVIELMLEYGAVNASNLDGGSSTVMYFGDDIINSCSSASGQRALPTAFVVSKED